MPMFNGFTGYEISVIEKMSDIFNDLSVEPEDIYDLLKQQNLNTTEVLRIFILWAMVSGNQIYYRSSLKGLSLFYETKVAPYQFHRFIHYTEVREMAELLFTSFPEETQNRIIKFIKPVDEAYKMYNLLNLLNVRK